MVFWASQGALVLLAYGGFVEHCWHLLVLQNAWKNSSLQMVALEQMKVDENVMKLTEDQKVCYLFFALKNKINIFYKN